jgi:hypothetical protein
LEGWRWRKESVREGKVWRKREEVERSFVAVVGLIGSRSREGLLVKLKSPTRQRLGRDGKEEGREVREARKAALSVEEVHGQ